MNYSQLSSEVIQTNPTSGKEVTGGNIMGAVFAFFVIFLIAGGVPAVAPKPNPQSPASQTILQSKQEYVRSYGSDCQSIEECNSMIIRRTPLEALMGKQAGVKNQ